MLRAHGASKSHRDSKGSSALNELAAHGHDSLLTQILEGEPELETELIDHALQRAAKYGYESSIRLLWKHGPNVNAKLTDQGWTALGLALRHGHKGSVDLLLSLGADVDAIFGEEDSSALVVAASRGFATIGSQLLEKRPNVHHRDRHGRTALDMAVRKNHQDIVMILLAHEDVDLKSQNSAGKTPLIWAAQNGNASLIKMILERQLDLNVRDSEGRR